jgi:hypothetical protein
VIVVLACGSPHKPQPAPAPAPVAPVFKCDDYAFITGEAGHTPASRDDSVDVQVVTACGCPYTVTTTGGMALRVTETEKQWRAAGCGPINCDEPCTAYGR